MELISNELKWPNCSGQALEESTELDTPFPDLVFISPGWWLRIEQRCLSIWSPILSDALEKSHFLFKKCCYMCYHFYKIDAWEAYMWFFLKFIFFSLPCNARMNLHGLYFYFKLSSSETKIVKQDIISFSELKWKK